MKDRKAKVVATATAVGLAALGGAALGSNHGLTAPIATTANGRAPIVTGASGSTATTQAVAGTTGEGSRAPIVTRASATATGASNTDD
jgi:putative Ca2+/H+ antiporter (TMEM165/GDT1 family)